MAKIYEKTGMYIDWDQANRLPEIDLFIDVGVGPKGTPLFWDKFSNKKIICIDPLDEARKITEKLLSNVDHIFHQCALGSEQKQLSLNIENNKGRSSFLETTLINTEDNNPKKKVVDVVTMDSLVEKEIKGKRIGIKIDTEGYELEILKGAVNTLSGTIFVIAEVRHNYLSFKNQYTFKEFNKFLFDRGFLPSIVFTAKPLIIDLCYEKI